MAGSRVRVRWEGSFLTGVRRVGPLRRTTDVITHRHGGDPSPAQKLPGSTDFEPLTLELDPGRDPLFEQWADTSADAGADGSAVDRRTTLRVELCDDAGRVLLALDVHRCWVSQLQVVPDGDDAGTAPTLHLRIENEGWVRDTSVPGPRPGPAPVDP